MVTSWERVGAEKERRETLEALLKVRFGNLDADLEAIIPQLMQLSREESLSLLLQANREELLSRFKIN
ncbi:hypothetical protein [Nostoc sp. FACHB-190]|uniref:hypothetical protein n=1 Tax=Nostoc sp. FACHB-190 TaxID=2692838 RepID=UPI001688871B|nr:hypothetical protein [Nostoc sp. FACHB-190]MBD2303223.1 hypothetical protein [Nostoc sp. FACHB-190]